MSNKIVTGSGVLLVSIVKRVPCVVLVYSKSKKAFEDPGGRIDHYDKSIGIGIDSVVHDKAIKKTAQRELFEETACLVYTTKKMLNQHIDVLVKRNQKVPIKPSKPSKPSMHQKNKGTDKVRCYYRCYIVNFTGNIDRKYFHENLGVLKSHPETPKSYLESEDMVMIPLILFQKIYKFGGGRFAIKIDDKYIPITKRLKRIMLDGGLSNIARVLHTTQPSKIQITETKEGLKSLVIRKQLK